MTRRGSDERGLVTLLFTDIVGSSDVASQLGDERWHRLQARHHAVVRNQLKQHQGHEVDTAGDGFFASFTTPARGVRCAFAIVREVRELGLDVRAGLHIGEAQLTGEKVGGIAVTTAARVSAAGGPGQVLATDTIAHMVMGSGFEFTDLGSRELKGVPGRWELFSLEAVDGESIGLALDADQATEYRQRASEPPAPRRSARRTWPLLVAALLAAASVAAVLSVTGRSDSTFTPPPTPAPHQALVAIEDGSGAEAFPVDLPALRYPFIAGPIVLTGRAPTAFAWLPSGGGAAQVNRTDGAVADPEFPLRAGVCPCLAFARGRLWYPMYLHFAGPGNYTGLQSGPGVVLDGVALDGTTSRKITVDRAVAPTAISGLASGGGYLWLADSFDQRVYRVDPTTEHVKLFPLHQGADLMVFADQRLWAVDSSAGKISRLDPGTGHLKSADVSGDLERIAVGGGYAWVTDTSNDKIQQIPEDLGSAPVPISVGEIGDGPKAIAYDHGALVVGFADGTLAKINPVDASAPALFWRYPTTSDITSITVDRDIVWAAGPRIVEGL